MAVPEVKCPTCGKTVQWTKEAKYRPFCSHRCHMIDLGDWITEGHKIPGDPTIDDMMSDDIEKEMKRLQD